MATIIKYKTLDHAPCSLGGSWQYNYTNTYDTTNDIGTITFEGDITAIPNNGFDSVRPTLVWIDIPSGITSIGYAAFAEHESFSGITFHSAVEPTIQTTTFRGVSDSGTITKPADGSYTSVLAALSRWTVIDGPSVYYFNCNSSKSLNSGQTSGYITVTTNIPSPTISVSDAWLTATWNGSRINLSCSANEGAQRTATITVSYNSYTYKTISVSQDAAVVEYYFNCDSSRTLTSGQTSDSIVATTNIPSPTITSSDAWLTASWNGSQINLSCSANTGLSRTATITVTYNSQTYKTITVSQDIVENTTFYYESTDGNIVTPNSAVTVISNTYDAINKGVLLIRAVSNIPNSTFSEKITLQKITIPNGITSIGSDAFWSCSSLTNIVLPNSLTSIGNSVFYGCSSLTNIVLPNSLTYIGYGAFWNCTSLTSINLPNTITTIGDYAFDRCSSLTNIVLPNSLTSIGNGVFSGCTSLTSVNLPNTITTIGDYAFRECYSLTNIVLPNSLTSIGILAFHKCSSLTNIVLPNSLTSIRYGVFYDCTTLSSITSYNLTAPILEYSNVFNGVASTGVLRISSTASGYDNWIGTYLPSGWHIEYIGAQDYTFYYESTDGNIVTPSGVATVVSNTYDAVNKGILTLRVVSNVPDNTFLGKITLQKITIPSGITSIGEFAFYGCTSLTSVNLPNTITTIGDYAFDSCSSITNITLPSGITRISAHLFQNCTSLTNINIPSGITSIGDYAFYGCSSLTNAEIKITLSAIGIYQGCTSLSYININTGCTGINAYNFSGCTTLSSITSYNMTAPDLIGTTVFDGVSPSGVLRIYSSASGYDNWIGTYLPIGWRIEYIDGKYFTFPESARTFNQSGHTVDIKCQTNATSALTFSADTWVHNISFDYQYNIISFVIDANSTYFARTTQLQVLYGGSVIGSMTINQTETPYFQFPYSAITISSGSSEWNDVVISGCSSNITSGLFFYTGGESMGVQYDYTGHTLYLQIARNLGEEKHITLTARYSIGGVSTVMDTLNITQQAAPYYFVLGWTNDEVSSGTTSYAVSGCSTNVESGLVITSSANWVSGTYDYSGSTLNLTMQTNPNDDARNAVIDITKDSAVLASFYLIQRGITDYQILFSPSSPHISPISGETLTITVRYKNTTIERVNDCILNSGGGIRAGIYGMRIDGIDIIGEYTFYIDSNDTHLKIDSNIVFSFVNRNGLPYERTYFITQLADAYVSSIWADCELKTIISPITYSIEMDGEDIYDGRGFKFPNADYSIINVSKIVMPQLDNILPNSFVEITGGTIQHDMAFKHFVVKEYYTQAILGEFSFLFNYDYEPWNGSDRVLTEPINGHLDSRMKLFFTKYKNNSGNILIEIE